VAAREGALRNARSVDVTRLSVWTVRVALLYLDVGFLIGALMLTQKGVPLDGSLLRLLPLHIDVLLFGWTLQLAMGIAFWILPRFSREPRYGNQTFGWLAFALINFGVWCAGVGQWLNAPLAIILLGRAAELLAVACFTLHAWPRVKAIGV
jgi:cbb3-type cytochrome oxidase subunit 1